MDMVKKMLHIILSILGMCILLSLWGFYSAIRPFKITSPLTPAYFNIPYQNVSFRTKDNILIRGWFIKNKHPHAKTLILLHGYPADKSNILPSTIFLHHTYHLLYIDFRYLGESGGTFTTIGKNEILDLLAAIQYLHTQNIHEVGIWGFSLGGAVALMTAPFAPEIKAIVSDSSYARLDWLSYDYYRIPLLKYLLGELTRLWSLLFLHDDIKAVSPAIAATKLRIPILLIHSKDDEVVSFDHALLLQQASKENPLLKTYFIDQLAHGQHSENYQKILQQFFNAELNKKTNKNK